MILVFCDWIDADDDDDEDDDDDDDDDDDYDAHLGWELPGPEGGQVEEPEQEQLSSLYLVQAGKYEI